MFVELSLTVPILAYTLARYFSALCLPFVHKMAVVKRREKMRAKASLALSMFDTVDSRFFEPSREMRI